MDDPDGLMDRNGRTPSQAVRDYVAARRAWELATAERTTNWRRGEIIEPDRLGAPDDVELERAWSELRHLRERWCTPAAVARVDPHAAFGTAPAFSPDDLKVLSVHRVTDQEVRLRTREYPYDGDLATEYDYAIHRLDGEWRLEQRSTVGVGGEVIRDLL